VFHTGAGLVAEEPNDEPDSNCMRNRETKRTVLGVAGGIAALIFSKALGYSRPRLRRLPRWAWYIQPPIAGLIVGAIAYFGAPQVIGPGYNVIDQAMHGQFTWKFLLALALLKIVATTISFSSGTPGGMFAPTLFIGAMLGASIGTFEKIFFHSLGFRLVLRVGRDGSVVRGFLTRSVDLGFHGARGQRQLLDRAPGYSGQHEEAVTS
jgi:H+/Cl- antiporter ClcA